MRRKTALFPRWDEWDRSTSFDSSSKEGEVFNGECCRGFSLIEILMGVVLGAMVFLAGSKLFSSGIKTSMKGTLHLTNYQATAILMSQLEHDLSRAVGILLPAPADKNEASQAQFNLFKEKSAGGTGIETVFYEPLENGLGIKRKLSDGSNSIDHVFCRNLKTEIGLRRMELPNGKLGFWVRIKTGNPTGPEEFILTRFFFCPNVEKNFPIQGWEW